MYRVLRAEGEVAERRRQATHPPTVKPELVADAPNRVWSWDITKLLGPAKWTYYYLYVILDIFSRYAVGWMVAEQQSAILAERLLDQTITKQHIARDQLAIHADRGSSMPPSRSLSSWPTSASPSRTPARTSAATTPTARASSRPSSTAPPSPTGSVRSSTPAPSASSSSAGTTPSIIIRASGCWSPLMSTTAAPSRSGRPGPRCSPPPIPRIPSGSSASHPSHQPCQPSPGSTTLTHRRPPSNSLTLVPHPG
jgi:Integrase core domain